ncbi:sugar-binding domain-containing protein [Rhodocytophaga rosea]|uniref:sugar-binding domain-containing protein n=1 Tax=Rhodocytophaga rosea TaxID=2704465 RepID=UPI0018D85058|nr:sugar-binding domain-containing protein [Rhodocytophaga rosea]
MKKVKNYRLHIALWLSILCISSSFSAHAQGNEKIDLSGEWAFATDPKDEGVQGKWFSKKLEDNIQLPGSMTSNSKGDDITVETPWTGSIFDSAYFKNPEYAKYRQPGNVKVPFWLQPVKYYKGPAWYQKTITIPDTWKGKGIELFIERSHWETTLWVDNTPIGMLNSLGTPHVFDLTKSLTPGTHQLTIRIDNRVKEFNVGQNSHSISDHTQSNWNGMVGQLFLATRPVVSIQEVQVYPDLQNKQVTAKITVRRPAGKPGKVSIELLATSTNPQAEKLTPLRNEVNLTGDSTVLELVYPMGTAPLLWDEFKPNLYSLQVRLTAGKGISEEKEISFGMREFNTKGTQFTINGRPTFLRGTLECAIFPKTGYPPTDVASWARIFEVCKSYGLNHMRFHSWCPPKAAFEAADHAGFYLQLESSSWANQGATIGDGAPLDQYIYAESERMVKAYGNHPSFCMLTYGNEPAGKNHVTYLINFVKHWQQKDPRRLYTTGAGWPVVPESDYNSTPDPRIQAWGAGLKSIINSKPPSSNYDWTDTIAKWQHPTVSHEIGQWCVYPDFKEIAKYDGVLKARNFEIFQEKLQNHGMASLADSFLLASGKLQALCYKADIEAALRTPGFGGFQLLDLHDFPGQGTALVGVLNPFWEDKGYITGKEYSQFCNTTVPLARLPKMIYLNNEELRVPVEVAHFGESELKEVIPTWTLTDASGKIVLNGQLAKTNIALGNAIKLGEIRQSLSSITQPGKLVLTVAVGNYQNTWDLFVYPSALPTSKDNILVTQQLDEKALKILRKGATYYLPSKKARSNPTKAER